MSALEANAICLEFSVICVYLSEPATVRLRNNSFRPAYEWRGFFFDLLNAFFTNCWQTRFARIDVELAVLPAFCFASSKWSAHHVDQIGRVQRERPQLR